MTIKTNVQLPRSNREGVKPRADELDYGNLAVNFFAGDEFLSTKNSNKEVVVFPSKNYIEKHPFSNLTIDNLVVNSGASISGNTIIDGGLKVSGDTYLDGRTYLKSGNNLVAIENFITETAKADGNDYITGGSATNNTISLTGKGSARATIEGVVTTDKIAEEVVTASNWKAGAGNSAVLLKNSSGSAVGEFSVSEGKNNTASGSCSHAEGEGTHANGNSSHAEGYETNASGSCSHAEGRYTNANGDYSHAEGYLTNANGDYSHAEGRSTTANGEYSHAEGDRTHAVGDYSHVEGNETTANGDYSHAEGTGTTAFSPYSHAEGSGTTALGSCSHAEGNSTHANGDYSHAEGSGTSATSYSHSEGDSTNASGSCSHAEGTYTKAVGDYSHAEGEGSNASGYCSHAEGGSTTASGNYSHAEGSGTNASGSYSHAEGASTTASGNFSHAEGYGTKAVGERSHAEGEGSNANGYCSHAEGFYNTASGNFSHAEGYGTTAIGTYSHAEGTSGIAYGNAGHVEGIHTQGLNIVKDVNSGDTHITVLFYPDSFNFNLDYYKNCYICDPNQWKTKITGASYDTSATIPDGAKAIRFEVEDALPIDAKQADEEENNRHGTHFYTWKYSITNIGTTRDYAQHAEGEYTMCIGNVSHAEGKTSMAVGEVSHAEGQGSIAYGDYSHAEGNHTIAMNEGEHACGSYNRSASGSGQVFSVGVGTSNDNRVNSFYVKNDGTIGSDLDMSISGKSKITLSTASDKLIMSAGTLTTNCTMTTGAYFTTSDKRLKTNVIDVTEDEIEKAKKVDLKSFNLKRDGKKHFGVVAQEVEDAGLAELVNTDSEGMKSVDYTSLLILKIAELEKEIKDLKNQTNNK